MIELKIKNTTGKPYSEIRDNICEALTGNIAFRNNDILVSDEYEEDNIIDIILGDESNPLTVSIDVDITDFITTKF